LDLTARERAIIKMIRKMEWGELRIVIEKGVPRRAIPVQSFILRDSGELDIEQLIWYTEPRIE